MACAVRRPAALLFCCLLAHLLQPSSTGFSPTLSINGRRAAPGLGANTAVMQLGSKRANRRRRGAQVAERNRELDRVRLENPGSMLRSRGPGERAVSNPPFRYLCVLDVEATCEKNSKSYVHEIIEFPVVVLDLYDKKVVGEFHTYVRPTVNATLSAFCTRLTGITQERVDNAPTLDQVLESFESWRLEQQLVHSSNFVGPEDFAFGADGPWDLRFFLHGECKRKGIEKAAYFDKWVNIKSLFADFYRTRSCKIHKMLEIQGMRFEGRLHSGIDDTRNIARIAQARRPCRWLPPPWHSFRAHDPPWRDVVHPQFACAAAARQHVALNLLLALPPSRVRLACPQRMAEDGCSFYLNEALSPRDRGATTNGFGVSL